MLCRAPPFAARRSRCGGGGARLRQTSSCVLRSPPSAKVPKRNESAPDEQFAERSAETIRPKRFMGTCARNPIPGQPLARIQFIARKVSAAREKVSLSGRCCSRRRKRNVSPSCCFCAPATLFVCVSLFALDLISWRRFREIKPKRRHRRRVRAANPTRWRCA